MFSLTKVNRISAPNAGTDTVWLLAESLIVATTSTCDPEALCKHYSCANSNISSGLIFQSMKPFVSLIRTTKKLKKQVGCTTDFQ